MDKAIKTTKLNSTDNMYIEQYIKEMSSQSKNISEISKWVISIKIMMLNFYIGLYVYLSKNNISVEYSYLAIVSAIILIASIFVLVIGVIPRKWEVDVNIIDTHGNGEVLGIKEYFIKSGKYKYKILIISLVLLFSSMLTFLSFVVLNRV